MMALGDIMRIVNLASGSKANSTFISFGETKILIDVGLSEKKLAEELTKIGESLNNILAVLITHEHSDHIKGLKMLAKHTNIVFYVHEKLANSGVMSDITFKDGAIRTFTDKKINIGDLEIEPIETSHDAVRPVVFVVNVHKSKVRAGFVTDLGIVTEKVKNSLKGLKIIFLESNYDDEMIDGGPYPYIVKQRIKGEKGHLSNAQSLELAKYLYKNGTECFVLSHISQNNNTYEKAYVNYATYFEGLGLTIGKQVKIKVSFQEKHGNNFLIYEDYDE